MIKIILEHFDDTKLQEAKHLFDLARTTGWDSVKIICEQPEDDYNEYSST